MAPRCPINVVSMREFVHCKNLVERDAVRILRLGSCDTPCNSRVKRDNEFCNDELMPSGPYRSVDLSNDVLRDMDFHSFRLTLSFRTNLFRS